MSYWLHQGLRSAALRHTSDEPSWGYIAFVFTTCRVSAREWRNATPVHEQLLLQRLHDRQGQRVIQLGTELRQEPRDPGFVDRCGVSEVQRGGPRGDLLQNGAQDEFERTSASPRSLLESEQAAYHY